MPAHERIELNRQVMLGKPVIRGTRVTVELSLRKMSQGESIDGLLAGYPHLTRDDLLAALAYAADVLSHEVILEPAGTTGSQ